MAAFHHGLAGVASLGYLVLAAALIRSESFYRVPLFTAFCLASAAHAWLWDPYRVSKLSPTEGTMLILKACVSLEAFWIATERLASEERRNLLMLVVSIAVLGLSVTLGLFSGDNPLEIYRAARQHVHTGLAWLGAATVGCLWIHPTALEARRRNHCLILCLYFVNYYLSGLAWRLLAKGGAGLTVWTWNSIAFFSVTLCCLGLWLRWGLIFPLRLPKPLPLLNSVDAPG